LIITFGLRCILYYIFSEKISKKYYAVSGETYKDLLQKSANKKGKETRQYYRRVEQLAIFMKDYIYISVLHKHLLEIKLSEKDKVIENKDKVIEDNKVIIENNEAKINHIHLLNEEYLSYKKLNEKKRDYLYS
jgi:hypothetical protein